MDYYISDTHFGHAGIIKFCARPFREVAEMNRVLIENWNARVSEDDDVWILGDVVFERDEEPGQYLSRLAGHKHLIIGNHDEHYVSQVDSVNGTSAFTRHFESIDYALRRTDEHNRKLWMAHYPLMEGPRDTWLLYGHIHNHKNLDYWNILHNNDRALNCSCEVTGYMPVTFDELVRFNDVWRQR